MTFLRSSQILVLSGGRHFKAQVVNPIWVTESWIGTMVEYRTMEALCEDMLHEGMGSIQVRYLRDKAVLLTPNDGIKLEDFIKDNEESLQKCLNY